MSGHSKWATTKRAKAVVDAKKGAAFTRIGKLITVAAREKGGDITTNFSLRMAVDKAKAVNMPKENIERAIKRGTGELEGGQIEELIYEAIGPANSQFIVKCLTDNKNKSAAEIRHLFAEHGGSLGSVAWNFEKKGVIRVGQPAFAKASAGKQDDFELEIIDAGAQDIKREEEGITIETKVEDLQKVKKFLEDRNIETESADIEYVAKDEAEVSGEDKEKVENFINELEDNEDVAEYYTNIGNV